LFFGFLVEVNSFHLQAQKENKAKLLWQSAKGFLRRKSVTDAFRNSMTTLSGIGTENFEAIPPAKVLSFRFCFFRFRFRLLSFRFRLGSRPQVQGFRVSFVEFKG
jgi:hypothetical protein